MKKIVLITNIPSPYNVDLFYYLQTKITDYSFKVIYTNKSESNREWNIDNSKILNTQILKSHIIKIKTRYDVRYIHIPKNINQTLSDYNPDIVIAWEYNLAAISALLWTKKKKRKYISVTEGTLLSERDLNFLQKITRKIIKNNADAFLVSGVKAKEKLLSWGVKPEKIFTELLTVDISKLINCPHRPKGNTILYVGSMVERKGVDLLIRSLPYVHGDFELRVVGNGSKDDYCKLKKIAAELDVADKIKWLGFKEGSGLLNEYSNATVFVLPTREDCFGLVLLEALAVGVPIVSSKYADGAYDVIDEEKTGFIVDPYNAKELADKINYVLENPEFQKACFENSRKSIVKFSFSNVAQGFIDAIEYVTR